MFPHPFKHRDGQYKPGAATAAFAFVLITVGAIGATLGSEAGLLAFILALFALIAAPYVYASASKSDPSGSTIGPTDTSATIVRTADLPGHFELRKLDPTAVDEHTDLDKDGSSK